MSISFRPDLSFLVESINQANVFVENNSNETDSESENDSEISKSFSSSRMIEEIFVFQLHHVSYRVNPYGNVEPSILQ